jgi:PAS domain S-box-containing protein
LCAALEGADAPATNVEIEALGEPASTAQVEERVTGADCVLVTERARHRVEATTDRRPPVVLLLEEFSTEALERGVETDVEAFLPREAMSEAPGLVAQRVRDVLATGRSDRETEHEYEQIFDGVTDAISVHDPETGEILDVNETYVEEFGYDVETIREMGVGGLSVAEAGYTAERSRGIISQVAETGETETVEWLVEAAGGERKWFEVKTTPAVVGGEQRVLGISRNVTERKRREREYEQIFNGVPGPIAINDPETGELLDVNDTMCDLLGYDRETILALGVEGISAEEEYDGERAARIVRRVMNSGEPETFEWRLETAAGETRVLEVTGTPAEIGGEPRYVSLTRDITERKRREREFEQIFDGVNDAITVHDPETAEILRANESYLEMLGYDSVDRVRELGIAGLSATDEGYTAEAGRQLIREAGREETVKTAEWRVERADGERLWLEATLTPGEVGGEPRVISIQRDVTDTKRREQQLAVFNRVLRHNLRNRVDVIRSHAETLRSHDAVAGHARQIIENADRLATLGARVRDADRLLRRDPRPRRVDPSETVRSVVDEVASGASDLAVRTSLPAGVTIQADEEALRMVLRSALTNAVEHASGAVEIEIEPTDGGITVRVEDDGPGIPTAELEALEAGTESMLQHSRGLGLWRIRWGTELLNGRLSFDVDDGTTVTVTLPDQAGEA